MIDGLYKWLGFGPCRAPIPETRKGAAPGCGSSRTIWLLSWKDRLRFLISGKVMVDVALQMDRVPKLFEATWAISALAPNHPLDEVDHA